MSHEVTIQEMGSLARAFAQSNFFGFKNEAEAFTLMAIAQANGLHPAKAAERYHIIQGRPAMKADAMLSSFQESGGKVKWIKRTDTECRLWLSHPQGGELEVTWNMERAKNAGLTGKSTWKAFPTQMLAARCVSEGVRALYPACLSGMYTPEEVADFATAPKAEQAEGYVVDDVPQQPAPQANSAARQTPFQAFSARLKAMALEDDEAFEMVKEKMRSEGWSKPSEVPESQYTRVEAWWNAARCQIIEEEKEKEGDDNG